MTTTIQPDTDVKPETGVPVQMAAGIWLVRLPLPFRLDHVNVYWLEGTDGLTIVDSGIDTPETRTLWDQLLAGPLKGRRVIRLIATHHHPDHAGLALWLCERLDIPFWCSEVEYLTAANYLYNADASHGPAQMRFYVENGVAAEEVDRIIQTGHAYKRMMSGLPDRFHMLRAGDWLDIGLHGYDVLTGCGHAPEQILLHDPMAGCLFAADQILDRISPNISVFANAPDADPLGGYLTSLHALKDKLAPGTLILPGHGLPFDDPHRRIDELIAHHRSRCESLLRFCSDGPKSNADLVPMLFRPGLTAHDFSFAFAETLAHLNRLVATGQLKWENGPDGIRRAVRNWTN